MSALPGWVNDPGSQLADLTCGDHRTPTDAHDPALQGAPVSKGLIAGPIIAYRFWAVRSQDGDTFLTSLNSPDQRRWMAGMPMQAICSASALGTERRHPRTSAPDPTCRCGLYALKQPREYPDRWVDGADSSLRAIAAGQVALWGVVIEHEQGYRAEYAYPVAIWPWRPANLPPGFPWSRSLRRLFQRLGETYGCLVLDRAPTPPARPPIEDTRAA
jgi:hypothetical protein